LFLEGFADKTAQFSEVQRKSVLDGMLYEVFFDSEGQHREKPKFGRFDEIFELQSNTVLADSFSFIQACLAAFADYYFEIAGSGNEVTLSVSTTADETGARVITDVWSPPAGKDHRPSEPGGRRHTESPQRVEMLFVFTSKHVPNTPPGKLLTLHFSEIRITQQVFR
jgi:hypothetical protein